MPKFPLLLEKREPELKISLHLSFYRLSRVHIFFLPPRSPFFAPLIIISCVPLLLLPASVAAGGKRGKEAEGVAKMAQSWRGSLFGGVPMITFFWLVSRSVITLPPLPPPPPSWVPFDERSSLSIFGAALLPPQPPEGSQWVR